MDRNYFIDTLFDLINESDELEVDIQDVQADEAGLKVTMKDGTTFTIQIIG